MSSMFSFNETALLKARKFSRIKLTVRRTSCCFNETALLKARKSAFTPCRNF